MGSDFDDGSDLAHEAKADRLRILHAFSTFAIGGPQVRLAMLANAAGRQFDHSILAMDGCYDCLKQFDPALNPTIPDISFTKGRTVANVRAFRRGLQRLRPDLLISYNWGAIEWALAAGLTPGQRHVHIEDGFGPGEETGPLWRRSAFRRLALHRSERVIVPSLVLRKIAATAWKISPHRIAYIPNGIDCQLYQRKPDSDLLPASFRDEAAQVIGTIATLRPEKNIFRLLSAFRLVLDSHPEAKLAIVGDGSERSGLESRATALGLGDRVAFTGNITGPERIIGLFDIFALSSNTEQMPISVLEAMAAGLPIAATNVGDVAQMVAAPNRPFVVSKGDGGALAPALITLLDNPRRRCDIGQQNREKVQADYALSDMLRRHLELWRGNRAPAAAGP